MILSSTDARDIRKFGVMAFVLFGVLSAMALWRQKHVPGCFLGGLSFLGLCFLLLPGPFLPVYTRWLKIAHFVGTVTTKVLLMLVYFLAFTPMALIHRLLKGSLLPLSPDKSASTYWVSRSEPAQPRDRFIKRY